MLIIKLNLSTFSQASACKRSFILLNDITYSLEIKVCGLKLDCFIFVFIQFDYLRVTLFLGTWNRELCFLGSWRFCYLARSNILVGRNLWWSECLWCWNFMWVWSFHQRFWVFYQLFTDECWIVFIDLLELLNVSLTLSLLFQSFRSFLCWRI